MTRGTIRGALTHVADDTSHEVDGRTAVRGAEIGDLEAPLLPGDVDGIERVEGELAGIVDDVLGADGVQGIVAAAPHGDR